MGLSALNLGNLSSPAILIFSILGDNLIRAFKMNLDVLQFRHKSMTQQIERIESVAHAIGIKGFRGESQTLLEAAGKLREIILTSDECPNIVDQQTRLYKHTLFNHDRISGSIVMLDDANKSIELSQTENRLLAVLEEKPNMIWESDELVEKVFDFDGYSIHNVHVLVGRLRRKLNDDPRNPQIIMIRRGFGYYLKDQGKIKKQA